MGSLCSNASIEFEIATVWRIGFIDSKSMLNPRARVGVSPNPFRDLRNILSIRLFPMVEYELVFFFTFWKLSRKVSSSSYILVRRSTVYSACPMVRILSTKYFLSYAARLQWRVSCAKVLFAEMNQHPLFELAGVRNSFEVLHGLEKPWLATLEAGIQTIEAEPVVLT